MKIDGAQIANTILSDLKTKVSLLKKKNLTPHLAVVLVGTDPSSVSYVTQKEIKGEKIGTKVTVKNISTNITQSKLLKTIEQLNNDNNIHGIIVQRPLPASIDTNAISLAINPKKDVDGFHPDSKFQPPIALAVLKILKVIYSSSEPGTVLYLASREVNNISSRFANAHSNNKNRLEFIKWLTSQKIVVIGKGETGGRPIIETFRKMGIKPTVIDSKTPNPEIITKKADIIISAVGKANIVRPEMIKKEVILISVGLHKDSNGKLQGDYDGEKIKNITSFYTPTPGGVGPVNVAMLLKNLVKAAEIN